MPTTKKLTTSKKVITSKKVTSKKIETFFDSMTGSYISKTGDKCSMYNIIKKERTPISKEYYNYKKFVTGNSNIKPIHIAGGAATIGLGAAAYYGNKTATGQAIKANVIKAIKRIKVSIEKKPNGNIKISGPFMKR